jgi:hypothetical protein
MSVLAASGWCMSARRLAVAVVLVIRGAALACAASAQAATIDWKMPNRLSPAIEESWASNPWGLPSASYVSPPNWKVELFLTTSSGTPICPDFNRHFIWTVTGEGMSEHPGRPPSGPGSGSGVNCHPTATVSKLGVYHVTATEYTNHTNNRGEYIATGKVYQNADVRVRDWLIVGLGDSNASGEGNPPWIFPQCDRSLKSYQNFVADYVGLVDPRTSVTFIPAGCSGARIGNLLSTPYEGIEPKLGTPLPPQIEQVRASIRARHVDGVIMSIGINNIYFSPLLKFCIAHEERVVHDKICQSLHVTPEQNAAGEVTGYTEGGPDSPTLEQATQAQLASLSSEYAALATGLNEKLHPAHVFITQYPNISTGADGETCGDTGPVPRFFSSTWGWLERTGDSLNAAVARTASLGWVPVRGIPAAFVGHGYCSPSSYFVSVTQAVLKGDTSGAFHPTVTGQGKTYKLTVGPVCKAFYGNPDCHGLAPPPLAAAGEAANE